MSVDAEEGRLRERTLERSRMREEREVRRWEREVIVGLEEELDMVKEIGVELLPGGQFAICYIKLKVARSYNGCARLSFQVLEMRLRERT